MQSMHNDGRELAILVGISWKHRWWEVGTKDTNGELATQTQEQLAPEQTDCSTFNSRPYNCLGILSRVGSAASIIWFSDCCIGNLLK
ncbi:hypothetical protein PGTUg99_036144 [Puccinia graminis f. sp. tritici]|uniref:Uncharacterized protein n=1 Tax=Puccinia graminis f. sp. tritici TaxID=56615 RepID=A0A5B0N6P1_PUCGR|nr:hypothetical protein PGTUg99_036144 [Puccinia graminis f. sp. tritici]